MGSVESGPIHSSQVVRFSHMSTSCLISCEGGGEGGSGGGREGGREGLCFAHALACPGILLAIT